MPFFAKLFAEAGFPSGVVNVVTGFGQEVGEPLVTHPQVAHVGFTGGEGSGRKIYELARAGAYTEAMQWNYRLLRLFDAMLDKFEFPDGFKYATELRGFNFGPSRRPLSDAQRADRSLLESDVKRALSDLVEPAPAPTAAVLQLERDQIAALVQEVVSQLDRRGLL